MNDISYKNYFNEISENNIFIIFKNCENLTKLSCVSHLFNSRARQVALEIYEQLVKTYSSVVIKYTLEHLGIKIRPVALLIDTLFKHVSLSQSNLKQAKQIESYNPLQLSKIVLPLTKANYSEILFTAVYKKAPTELQKQMKQLAFRSNPIIRQQQIRDFFEQNERQLAKIEELDLSNLELHFVPQEIKHLKNLKTLNLSGNRLCQFPKELIGLKNLQNLNLSNNRIRSLSKEIVQLMSLNCLVLNKCCLKSLPPELGGLRNLKVLCLNHNQLVELPHTTGNLASLSCLSITHNCLKELPQTIGKLLNLECLYLCGNKISSLPSTMEQLRALQTLSMPMNQLSFLPEEIRSLKKLKCLVLDSNNLSCLPKCLEEMPLLQKLYVNGNKLENLPNLSHVKLLSVEENVASLRLELKSKFEVFESTFQFNYHLLGTEKWKECIDGTFHHFGIDVFDCGYHGGHVEPGYVKSMQKAFEFLSEHFESSVNASLYLELHRVCCAHFKGAETQTRIGQEKLGVFRNKGTVANYTAPKYQMFQEAVDEFYALSRRLSETFGSSFTLGEIIETSKTPQTFQIKYQAMTSEEIHMIFNLFLCDFNSEIQSAHCSDDVLEAIARLIQHLEWLHPPEDGCGRTDTALLNFLLSKYGFHPVILEYPYLSSCRGLDDWIGYLSIGMHEWAKAAAPNIPIKPSIEVEEESTNSGDGDEVDLNLTEK